MIALLCALAGMSLLGRNRTSAALVPLSGGLLLGVAAFHLIPELVHRLGVVSAFSFVTLGYAGVMLLDGFAYSVCPSCSHDHDHTGCVKTLHGFAGPLILAIAVHAFVDGWSLLTVQLGDPNLDGVGEGVAAAVLLHKIPEGLALGTMLRASTRRFGIAFALCLVAESSTLLGAAFGLWLTPGVWLRYLLAVAAGTFVFLGIHAVHGEWKRRGAGRAFVPTLAGAASAAILQQGIHNWWAR